MLLILKRDNSKVLFNEQKIINAILASFEEVEGEVSKYAEAKAQNIASYIREKAETTDHILTVEEIQDMVEAGLMNLKRKDVARAYITYRNERTRLRNKNSKLIKVIGEKLQASNVQNQNANVDEHSFGGRMGEANDALTKQYALDYIVSPMARENHLNNEIYIHDLGSYAVGMHNCLSVPFDDLLANGFNTRQTDVRPANSVNTAFQLVAVIFQLQSLQQFGGVSATHLDWTMVPYVRKSFKKHFCDGLKYLYKEDEYNIPDEKELLPIDSDEYKYFSKAYKYAIDMTERETYQAVEGMYHNLNTLQSRSGNQLPFTSINYGTCTLPEGRMVTKALLECSLKGVGKLHLTPIFPCGIFQCMKGVNRKPEDPNYDLFQLALKSTAKRLYPNYANVDWSGNSGYDKNDPRTFFSTMGCRTANGADINAEPGQNPQLKDGRGNICPVTIIMPTLAMEVLENTPFMLNKNIYEQNLIDGFMILLDQKIHEAKNMLIERFEYICSQSSESAKFMYENGTMFGYDGKDIRSALKHGTLALGQLGLAETLQILIGCDHTEEKGMELAKRIEQLFKDRCAEFKEKYKLNFGVYYTPAENLCYTAMQKFKARYGEIPNVSDKDFFTNSMHVPVWKNVSIKEKIDIEAQLTGYSSAGCITYVELPCKQPNIEVLLEQVVNYAMDKDIPYFAINLPNDSCLDCGFTDDFEEDECPKCHSAHVRHLRRVTGYLTGDYKSAFNKGKQQETQMRVKHYQVDKD